MAQQIQLRHDTAANWTSVNPTLMVGEAGYETDTGKLKVGDGTSAWTLLAYVPVQAGQITGTVSIAHGGTGVTAVTAAPAASEWAGWDANSNISANNFIEGYATTVTAGGTTVLTVASAGLQYFTGTSTQSAQLPVVTTLVDGQAFTIVNNSTGAVTVKTSGGNTLSSLPSNSAITCTCVNTAGGTGTASWSATGSSASPLLFKGDTFTYSTTNARQAAPGDYGRLIPDSVQSTGWRSAPYSSIQNGRPGKNYIQYADFENNALTGWSLGHAALTSNFPSGTPTFGTGADSHLEITPTSSGAIGGGYSLQYDSLAAGGAGLVAGDLLASDALTIDLCDQGRVLSFKFPYQFVSGTGQNFSGTSSNTLGVAIRDVTNSAWIMPAGVWNLVQGSGVGIAQGTFQAPVVSGGGAWQFRLVIFNANTTSAATKFLFDDFYVGPQSMAFGPAISDLGAKPWTPTGTWSTNTTWTGFYKQDGDTGKFYARATLTGAPTGTFTVNLPPGLSMDTTKLGSTAEELTLTGWCKVRQHNTGSYHINQIIYNGAASVVVDLTATTAYTGTQYPKDGAGLTATIPFTFAANDYVEVYWEAPIVGWSSNTVMSADSDTRVVAWQGYTTSTQSVDGSLPQVTAWTTLNDTHGAFSNNSYVVQVSGYYRMSGGIYFGTNAGSNVPSLAAVYKNGVQIGFGPRNILNASQNTTASFSNTFKFVSGDVITIHAYAASATSLVAGASNGDGIWSIEKLSGPAVVAASESVNARLTNTAGTSVGTSATVIPFATVSFDSHSTWNQSSNAYVCPVAGKYSVSAVLASPITSFATTDALQMYLYKNGSQYSVLDWTWGNGVAASVTYYVSGSDSVPCNAGDTLQIYATCSVSAALSTTTGANHVSIEKVGN